MNNITSTSLTGNSTGNLAAWGGTIPVNISTGTYISTGQSNGNGYQVISTDTNTTDFCELVLSVLGYDIKYDDFCKMTKEEKKSLLRDIKINKILC